MLYSLMASGKVLAAKYLYITADDLGHELNPFQVLLFRGMWSTIIMGMIQNVNWKKNCWDPVSKDNRGSLLFRTISGSITNIINLACA